MENPFDEINQRLLRIEDLLCQLHSIKKSDKKPDIGIFMTLRKLLIFLKKPKQHCTAGQAVAKSLFTSETREFTFSSLEPDTLTYIQTKFKTPLYYVNSMV
jgi:hypothetical protein